MSRVEMGYNLNTVKMGNTDSLINGDCLKIMPQMESSSVDLIMCDCPYQVLNKSNPGAPWDKEVPLGKLWEQWLRITKENAAIVLFGQGMFTAKLMMSQPKLWRYNLIWDKIAPTGFLNANRMPLRSHEDICVFYRKLPTYHPQMTKCESHKRNHSRGSKTSAPTNNCYGNFKELPVVVSDEKFPKSIVSFSAANRNEKRMHPSAKPVGLLRYLIRTYSNECDTVLDCCAGSCSTAIAAMREGRRYICIEKDDAFFETGLKRINEEKKELQRQASPPSCFGTEGALR